MQRSSTNLRWMDDSNKTMTTYASLPRMQRRVKIPAQESDRKEDLNRDRRGRQRERNFLKLSYFESGLIRLSTKKRAAFRAEFSFLQDRFEGESLMMNMKPYEGQDERGEHNRTMG